MRTSLDKPRIGQFLFICKSSRNPVTFELMYQEYGQWRFEYSTKPSELLGFAHKKLGVERHAEADLKYREMLDEWGIEPDQE